MTTNSADFRACGNPVWYFVVDMSQFNENDNDTFGKDPQSCISNENSHPDMRRNGRTTSAWDRYGLNFLYPYSE